MSSSLKLQSYGDYSKTIKYLNKLQHLNIDTILKSAGNRGVEALKKATPKDTGKTANSWGYEITKSKNEITITWTNSNIQRGINIAVILDVGHATKNGGYVVGRNYIEPALRPVFDKIADDVWKAVTSV